jgi:hypothetical protein
VANAFPFPVRRWYGGRSHLYRGEVDGTLSGELTIDNGDSSVLNVNIPSSETLGLPVYGQFTKFCFDIVGRWNTSPEVINRLAYGTFQVAPAVTTNWS